MDHYRKYKIIQNGDGYDILIYLNDYSNEFAQELNSDDNHNDSHFISMLKEKYPNLQFKSIKILTKDQIISHYSIM
jgi:hypothetical protein